MKNNPIDQAARDYALTPNQSFLVQAPAGSGKTELLTQRYLKLLSHAEKAPEEIVAITFTRKAAAEMRQRVLNALEMAIETLDETMIPSHKKITWRLAQQVIKKDKQLGWNLIENPSRMQILTIDALWAKICGQIPLLSSFGAPPTMTESADRLYSEAAKETILSIETNTSCSRSIELLLTHLDNQVDYLQQLFTHILAKRDQWLPHIINHWSNLSDLKTLLEQGLRHVQIEAIQSVNDNIDKEKLNTLIQLAHIAGCYLQNNDPDHPVSICSQLKRTPKVDENDFKYWYALANLLLTKTGQWRRTVDKRCGFPAGNEYKPFMEALLCELSENDLLLHSLNNLIHSPPVQYESSQWEIIHALLEILPILTAQLNIIFQTQGTIDFVELNLAALRALGDSDHPTDLALYMDHQIRHILVDEFQDTSVIQFNLLEQLVSGWQSDDGRTIFAVGDPMQSIYRFRNAEVGLFLQTKEKGIGPISLNFIQLEVNFRSEHSIVEWVNHAFVTIFPTSSDIALGAIPFTPAIAANHQTKNQSVYCHSFQDENEKQKIVETLQACWKRNPDSTIAILVRSRHHLVDILPFLRENQIHFQAIELESLYYRPEIQDVMALTKALLHLGDQTAWLSILRAPWCGLTLNDLHHLAQLTNKKTIWDIIKNFENLENLSQDAKLRLHRIVPILHHAFLNQSRIHFSHWIKGTWMALGGSATLFSPNEITNVEQFFHLLDTLSENFETFSIELLASKAQQLYATSNENANIKLQVMTIHRAKGLEFDHVILPGLSNRTSNDESAILMWQERPSLLGGNDLILAPIKAAHEIKDPIYQYLRRVEKQKLDYEKARLLYVAITRAKKSIHFFCELKSQSSQLEQLKAPDKGSFMEMLWPIYKEQMEREFSKRPKKQFVAPTSTPIVSRQLCRLTSDWQLPLLSSMSLSETNFPITHTQNLITVSEMKIENHLARISGTVIHEALQQLANDISNQRTIDINRHRKQWENRLFSLGIPKKHVEDLLSKVLQAVQQTLLDKKGSWILGNHHDAHNELALSAVINQELVHVILDRTFVDDSGIRWIIDYKTAHANDIPLAEFLEAQKVSYAPQLEQYAKVMQLLEPNPIKLGLYFPTIPAWTQWDYPS